MCIYVRTATAHQTASRMDAMPLEQLLTWAQAIMTEKPEKMAAGTAQLACMC